MLMSPHVKKVLLLAPELADRVQSYRFYHRMATEAQAMRDLLQRGLAAAEAERKPPGA